MEAAWLKYLPKGFELIEDEEEVEEEHPVERDSMLPFQSLPQGFEITDEVEKTPRSYGVTGEWEEEGESPWKKIKDTAIGTLETGMTFATGLAALPFAGVTALMGLPFGIADEMMEATQDLLVYEPKTEKGEKITQYASIPFEMIHDASKYYGDLIYEKTNSPNLAAGVAATFEIITYALLAKSLKMTKDKILGKKKATLPTIEEMQTELNKLAKKGSEPAKVLNEVDRSEFKKFLKEAKEIEPFEREPYELAESELKKPYKRREIPIKELKEPVELKVKVPRTIKDTLKDVNTLMGERGSISLRKDKMTPEQKLATERLIKDIEIGKDKALKTGKEFGQYLKDEGVPANMVKAITQFATEKGIVPPTKSEDIPKYARSINLEKQDIPDSLKRMEQVIGAARPKKVQTWDQTGKLSAEIQADYKKAAKVLTKAKRGQALTAAEIDAARQVNVNAIDELKNLATKLSPDEFNKTFNSYVNDIFQVTSEASSEIGRALNIHKKEVSINRIAKSFSELEKGLNERQLSEFRKLNMENPLEVKRFIERLENPRVIDYVLEFWYNSILSGIPTHFINVASNTSWLMYQVPHRLHVSFWDRIYSGLTGKARTRYIDETIPMMAGYRKGAVRGAKGAGQMVLRGEMLEFETKWAQEIGVRTIGAWERAPHKVMRYAGIPISMPTRALRAMDVWANSIAYDAEINSIARRLSKQKGLKGDAQIKWENEFKKNLPEDAHNQAMKYAKHNTFMDDPDPFTAWFLKLRKVPVIGPASQFVVPFVNTIGNLTKRGVEFTPGVGIAKEAIARKMGRGLGTPEMIAKQIEGSLLALYILYKCDKGEVIGQGGKTKAERDALYRQGKKPWSIKIKDTWYQYRRAEPWNTVIASVTIGYDEIKNAKDDATRTEIFGNISRGLANNLIDSSYFQGMQQIFNRYERFKTAPFRFGASFVLASSFWRSMNRAYEKATEGEVTVKEKSGWLSAVAQVIPGLAGKIPAQLNAWGKEKVISGSVFQHWLPYKWSKEIDDPVEKELERLKIYPGLPGQYVTIQGKKVKLDDDIYRKYCISYGHRAKAILDKTIKDRRYFHKVDELKIKQLDSILTSIRTHELMIAKMQQRKKAKKLSDKMKVALKNYYINPEDYLTERMR